MRTCVVGACCPNQVADLQDRLHAAELKLIAHESRLATVEASLSGVAELRKRVGAIEEGAKEGGDADIPERLSYTDDGTFVHVYARTGPRSEWIEQCAVPKSVLPFLVSSWGNQ